ncbi:MAG TPA: ATP synthase F1 subunit gamma [Thermoanaerobaculia bacterium]|nr:ATP synthase F1 subunit gamma [Thermoanaerobaculia bacterium]
MPSLLDIKRRIRSVKNTQQITKAMKMVAAAKLRRSQDRILGTRPYALELAKVTANLARGARAAAFDAAPEEDGLGGDAPGEDELAADALGEDELGEAGAAHPLLEARPEERVLLAVVTGDRGLAGSFNAVVLRRARQAIGRWERLELLLLGKKGADFFGRRKVPIRRAYRDLFASVTYPAAREIAEEVARAYADGEYDAVYVIYNRFVSVMRQELTEERLLPIPVGPPSELGSEPGAEPGGEAAGSGSRGAADYLFEPSPEAILAQILPRYLTFQVYRVLLESQAAEHAARMTAMDSATSNAGEMIEKLTLHYNRARQAAITKELIEVVSGSNALEG